VIPWGKPSPTATAPRVKASGQTPDGRTVLFIGVPHAAGPPAACTQSAVAGQGSDAYGVMHAEEITRRYEAKDAEFEHRLILISVHRTAADTSLYDATRYAWRIDPRRAANAEYALPLIQGLIVGAFEPAQWLEATTDNFPGREAMPGRWGFTGNEAPEHIRKLYVGRRVPAQYRRRGAANPIKYVGV